MTHEPAPDNPAIEDARALRVSLEDVMKSYLHGAVARHRQRERTRKKHAAATPAARSTPPKVHPVAIGTQLYVATCGVMHASGDRVYDLVPLERADMPVADLTLNSADRDAGMRLLVNGRVMQLAPASQLRRLCWTGVDADLRPLMSKKQLKGSWKGLPK